MITNYKIIKEGITIGNFSEEKDRDFAFDKFVLPTSNNCMKSNEANK